MQPAGREDDEVTKAREMGRGVTIRMRDWRGERRGRRGKVTVGTTGMYSRCWASVRICRYIAST